MLKLNPQRSLLYLFILVSIILVTSSSKPTKLIQSCLLQNHVMNFTVFQYSDNQTSEYYKLLNFSIQNLRFTEPTYPKPIAIVIPETKEQLVGTILCCRQGPWTIRIRCGGHSYEGLSSIASDRSSFVIVDLMNLNRVSVDLVSETAWVEGGTTLGEVYHAIAMSSVSHGFSAGSCPTVGSGGHIAGGGFGLLSRKYGLAADNVVDALLVDANGRLLDKEAMGEDAFWAIRGGGGGVWGVVYAWKLRLVSVPPIVTCFVISRPGSRDQVANLVHKWQLVSPLLPDDFYLSAFVGAGLPDAKGIGISVTFKGFYLGTKTSGVSILKEVFPELGIVQEDCNEMNWIESIVFFSDMDNGSSIPDLKDRYYHRKDYFKAKSDYVRVPIPLRVIRVALEILEKEPKGYVILDPYGGKMSKISSDSIPFPHREGNLFTIQYLVSWKEEDNGKSDEFINWIRGFYDFMSPYVAKGPRTAYNNYLDLDLGVMDSMSTDGVEMARAWGEKYFLHNYDRLVRAKTFLDPNNVFNNQQGIPPRSTLSQM
ncbi:reticuline oxidase-like [Telopea speciosissima]|uniref:reticuline oxidase-like n=1 Tax=Telopea speciosissima TaxID=54955 RepID=UPI001CC370D6|nr:reticuline oxidase-like [Telopea speciosissima]